MLIRLAAAAIAGDKRERLGHGYHTSAIEYLSTVRYSLGLVITAIGKEVVPVVTCNYWFPESVGRLKAFRLAFAQLLWEVSFPPAAALEVSEPTCSRQW